MNHQHLPALNRYTSPNQYEALQEIDKTRSLTALLMKGSMSKTVGSLIRSAWIVADNYTDEQGVVREGWAVSEAGKHAMRLYEAKVEEQRRHDELVARLTAERKARSEKIFAECVKYYEMQIDLQHQQRYVDMLCAGVPGWQTIAHEARRKVEQAQYGASK